MSCPSLHFLHTPKFWQRTFFAIACLITALAAAYAIENYRGRSEWARYEQEASAHGTKLEIEQLIKPPIPDEQNFGALPLFRELASADPAVRDRALSSITVQGTSTLGNRIGGEPLDFGVWRQTFLELKRLGAPSDSPINDVLNALVSYDEVLNQLRDGAQKRPGNRLHGGWEKGMHADFFHMPGWLDLCRLLSLRTSTFLAIGQSDKAFEEWRLNHRVCTLLRGEPSLLAGMLRVMMLEIAVQSLWEGLSAHQWSDSELKEIQAALDQIDLTEEYALMLNSERAFSNRIISDLLATPRDRLFTAESFTLELNGQAGCKKQSEIWKALGGYLIPDGWFYQNKLRINRWLDQEIAERHVPNYSSAHSKNTTSEQQWWKFPYNLLFYTFRWGISGHKDTVRSTQMHLTLCATACAIERYYLRTGAPPTDLSKLVPLELKVIPTDFNEEPLRFRKNADGSCIVYFVGQNQIDHGGDPEKEEIWIWRPEPIRPWR